MKKILSYVSGLVAGIVNGFLGAGGGMIIVPMLIRSGLDRRHAHATSVCIILPICILSAYMYITSGKVTINDAMPYLLWGVIGSVIGSLILQKINQNLLRKIFGILLIWASYRMVF